MTTDGSPKEDTRWLRTHFENSGSVLLQTEGSTRFNECFRPLVVTAAPVTEQVYVITADSKSSFLSNEFRRNPPPNTEILTSLDLELNMQVIRNKQHPSQGKLIIFIDSLSELTEQMGWRDFEDAINSIIEFASQTGGVVYIHQRKSEMDKEKRTALTRICDITAEYDEKTGTWIILNQT